MLDVHPPHEAAHSWKDFFIHIATIVVGLLIAVGLEQTVEFIHQRREAAELRERLHAESTQILADSRRAEAAQLFQLHWLDVRLDQVRTAILAHKPIPPQAADSEPYFASPDIPQWRAAHDSGLALRLTAAEVTGYAEVEYVQKHVEEFDKQRRAAEDQIRIFDRKLPRLSNGGLDFSRTDGPDAQAYLTDISAEADAVTNYLVWIRLAIGAEIAVTSGKLELEDIYRSERDMAHTNDNYDPHRL